jgi:CTLH/CRA C-terminal to LisH motif domain
MVRTRLGDNDAASNSGSRKAKNPMRYSGAYDLDGSTSGVFDHEMELDEPAPPASATNGNATTLQSSQSTAVVTDEDLLIYGQELKNEFKNASQAWMRGELDNILGLMAYENPKNSTLKDLLEVEGRVAIAEELNKAILGKSLLSPVSWNEVLTKQ